MDFGGQGYSTEFEESAESAEMIVTFFIVIIIITIIIITIITITIIIIVIIMIYYYINLFQVDKKHESFKKIITSEVAIPYLIC